MDGKVYAISITTGADGSQVPGIVFAEPVEGKVFTEGYVTALSKDGTWFDPTNDSGELPHRERTSEDEDLGLTWQFPK
jgi:hypothetical protein